MIAALDRGLARDKSIIGIVEEDGIIKASIGLFIWSWWYSDSVHLEDFWNFVHPEYRKSTHAKTLLSFARKASDDLSIQLLIGILSSERTAAKVRLYENEFGPSMGAGFVYPNPRANEVVRPLVDKKRRRKAGGRYSIAKQQVAAE